MNICYQDTFVMDSSYDSSYYSYSELNDSNECLIVFFPDDVWFRSNFEILFLIVITPIVVCLGSMFNLAFLFVLYRVEEMQTLTNFYLANLALADLGNLVSFGVHYVSQYINSPMYTILHGGWAYQRVWGCVLSSLSGYWFYFASVFLLTIVVFDRYMAICFPLKYRVMKTKSYVARVTCILWIVSLCMASTSSRYTVSGIGCIRNVSSIVKIDLCFANTFQDELETVVTSLDLLQFLLSVSTCIFMVTHIIYKLSVRVVSSNSAGTKKARNKIARMLIINAIIFFLCQVPWQIYNVDTVLFFVTDEYLISSDFTLTVIGWVGRVAGLVNSSINPIVYNMTNDRYREAFKAAFNFGRSNNKGSISTNTSIGFGTPVTKC